MSMNRFVGLGALALSSLVFAVACDDGGTSTNTTTTTTTTTTTGVTGTTTTPTTTTPTTTAPTTTTPTTTSTGTCTAPAAPDASGTIVVAAGYATSGSTLAGYGFTWVGELANSATCISELGGTSALCGAGTVGADTTFNSVAGVGMNLKQSADGVTIETVNVATSVTVTTSLSGSGTGNAALRVQITDANDVAYCVEPSGWTSGSPIPITSFDKTCWAPTATGKATAGMGVKAVHVTIPSSDTAARDFSVCVTGISVS